MDSMDRKEVDRVVNPVVTFCFVALMLYGLYEMVRFWFF